MAKRLFDLLLQTGMAAADLEIEITESILLDNEDVATATLRTLRGAGIRIALDDFAGGEVGEHEANRAQHRQSAAGASASPVQVRSSPAGAPSLASVA